MALGDWAGEPGFGFLIDQHLQKLSGVLGLALGDWAGEPGFGFLTDEHLQTLSREVAMALRDLVLASIWIALPAF